MVDEKIIMKANATTRISSMKRATNKYVAKYPIINLAISLFPTTYVQL